MISYNISVVISNIWGILKWPDYPSFYGHVINTRPVHVCGCHCLVTETFPPSWSRSPVLLETAYSSNWCSAVVWMNSKTLCTEAMRWQIMRLLTSVIRSPRAVPALIPELCGGLLRWETYLSPQPLFVFLVVPLQWVPFCTEKRKARSCFIVLTLRLLY